jgi:hypothetical protein
VFLALETKFLLFQAGQKRDSVLSRSTGPGLLTGFVFGFAPFDLGHAPGLDTGAGSAFRAPPVWVERHTASGGSSGTVELAARISSPWHVSP